MLKIPQRDGLDQEHVYIDNRLGRLKEQNGFTPILSDMNLKIDDEKSPKQSLRPTDPFYDTFGYLERLARVHMCILVPSILPTLKISSDRTAPATPVAITHALGYAWLCAVGDGRYEKACEIAAAHAMS